MRDVTRGLEIRFHLPPTVDQVVVDAPNVRLDYRSASFAELVAADLGDATVILEPSLYCDLRCQFCSLPVTSRAQLDWAQISPVLQALAIAGADRITMTGGEPGIYSRLIPMLEELARWGYLVDLLTHGLWAANESYLDRILATRAISSMTVSVKASNAGDFTAITGRARFDKQSAALANIARAVAQGRIARWTLEHVLTDVDAGLVERLDWAARFEARPDIVFSLVEPYLADMCNLVPAPERLRHLVAGVTRKAVAASLNLRFEGFPLCILGPAADLSLDSRRLSDARPRVLIRPREDADYVLVYSGYQRLRQFAPVEACGGCARRNACPGLHGRMAGAWGETAVRPFALAEG